MTRLNIALGLVIAGVFLTLPFLTNSGIVFLAGTTLIMAVFSLAWNLLFGYAGLASFGHGGLFSIGAYAMAVGLREGGAALFLPLLIGAALLGAVVSLIIGAVALRRTTGVFFAILTLSLAELLRVLLIQSHALGSEDGLPNIPRPVLDLGLTQINLAAGNSYYWFLCVICAVYAGALWWLAHGPVGRAMQAIRQDPDRAAFIGIDVYRTRVMAFVISGALATLAGALFAPWTQIVTPETGGMMRSAHPILYSLLGGAHSFWGPAIGAISFSFIEYGTRTFVGLQEMIIGAVLLGVILVFPNGITGAWNSLTGRRSRTPKESADVDPAH